MPSPPTQSSSHPPSSLRPPSLLGLLSYLAGSVARIGNRHLVAELEEHGLRLPQYAVLTALSDFGALAPHELALRLGADRSHISNYVEGLVRLGWVRRDPDPDDRRRHTVALTPAGRAPFTALQRAATGSQQILLRDLSPDEQQTLVTLLLKVITTADSSPTTRNG